MYVFVNNKSVVCLARENTKFCLTDRCLLGLTMKMNKYQMLVLKICIPFLLVLFEAFFYSLWFFLVSALELVGGGVVG